MPQSSSHKSPDLNVQGLSFSYGKRIVLTDIQLKARRGEVVFVVGPNGSGKSTLLRLLAGILVPSRGVLRWEGKAWKLGFSGGDPFGLFPQASAWENLRFFREWGGNQVQRSEVEAWANALGCSAWLDAVVQQLSTGNKQRMALLRSLLGNPDAVLWDEPFAHLDGDGLDRVKWALGDLLKRRALVVIGTPELPAAFEGMGETLFLEPTPSITNVVPEPSPQKCLE